MAIYYVYHAGSGAGGTSWATAYTTLTTAFSGKAAGDTFYVAHDHVESTAGAVTLAPVGTVATPTNIVCVNRAGSVPPVSADLRTTASVSTSGANALTVGLANGAAYYYGIKFQAGSGSSAASLIVTASSANFMRFDNCGLTLNNTATTSRINITTTGTQTGHDVQFNDCIFTFGSATQQNFTCSGGGVVTFRGGSVVVGANIPTTLFSSMLPVCRIIGMDLSAIPSGKTLIGANAPNCLTLLQDCKLAAGVTVAPAAFGSTCQEIYLVRSDSGDTNVRQEKYSWAGNQVVETTIVRTGGASDGTTPISWKIATNSNTEWLIPYEAMPRVIWNETTGSRTITVYGAWAGGAVPLDSDIWIEVSYLGTSGFPLALFASTNKANILATAGNTTADSSTWGGSIATKFKMVSTFTVNEKGPLMVIVKAAKVSSTFYIDPKIEVT